MSRAESGPAGLYHRVVVYVLFVILLLPLAGTLLYSLSTSWSASLLPSGLTFKWYLALWSEPRFLAAFGQSLLVCVGALVLSVLLILPLLFVVHYHFPSLDALMNILILLPFQEGKRATRAGRTHSISIPRTSVAALCCRMSWSGQPWPGSGLFAGSGHAPRPSRTCRLAVLRCAGQNRRH